MAFRSLVMRFRVWLTQLLPLSVLPSSLSAPPYRRVHSDDAAYSLSSVAVAPLPSSGPPSADPVLSLHPALRPPAPSIPPDPLDHLYKRV